MEKFNLNKVAPWLSEISPNDNSFKIPENYFDTIEDAVIAELNAEKIIEKAKELPFNTPEIYFESIEDIVISKLKAEVLQKNASTEIPKNYFNAIEDTVLHKMNSTSKVISLQKRVSKLLIPIAVAASLLLVFTLNNTSNKITFDSIATSEIENFIDKGTIDIDAMQLATIYPDIDLNINSISADITTNEVLEYLYKEDLTELIYEN